MAQNFKTRSVSLNQRQYEKVQEFPVLQVPERVAFPSNEYQVVDVLLKSGTRYEGLLVMDGSSVLVPEKAEPFEAEDIVEISPTQPYSIPDFTITEPEAIWDRNSIEWGNSRRLDLFGPEEEEPDWRSAPVEEAHEEALDDDRRIETYGGDLPANYGPHSIVLTKGGIRMSYMRARDDEMETVVIRPRNADLWAELLSRSFEIDPSFTLGEMIELLDLPPEVDREVYLRTMLYRRNSFRAWVEAAREEVPSPKETDIEYIEVGAYADESDGVYSFFYDVSGVSYPLKADDENLGLMKGERINYSLSYGGPARLKDVPLRYNPELVLPVEHEEVVKYLRGTLRDWRAGGEEGPKPEMPYLLKTKSDISLRDFIRAIFGELSSWNASFDEEGEKEGEKEGEQEGEEEGDGVD